MKPRTLFLLNFLNTALLIINLYSMFKTNSWWILMVRKIQLKPHFLKVKYKNLNQTLNTLATHCFLSLTFLFLFLQFWSWKKKLGSVIFAINKLPLVLFQKMWFNIYCLKSKKMSYTILILLFLVSISRFKILMLLLL